MYTDNPDDTRREYDAAMAVYERQKEKHEELYGNVDNFQEERPVFEEKLKFVDGVFTHDSMVMMGLTHYLVHVEDSETLSLIFIDNTRIVVQDTTDVRTFLNKVLTNDKLSK